MVRSLAALMCLCVLIAGCSGSDDAEIARLNAEAEAARTEAVAAKADAEVARKEALTAAAELAKARSTPVAPPEPKLSREQAIANIEKLGGKIEYEQGSKDGPISAIRLNNNRFTDDDLANLEPLDDGLVVDIVSSAVTDAGLSHLKGLTRVRDLSLFLCGQIDGSGFEFLTKLTNLEMLTLHGTRVNDSGLPHLRGLTSITYVNLIGCPITDAALENVARLPKLSFLDISGTKVTDQGLKFLGGSTMKMLILKEVPITSDGLQYLSGLPAIQDLSLENSPISDAGLVHLKSLPALRGLNLRGTSITDEGLVHLKGMSSLQRIHVQNTKVTEAGGKKLQESLPTVQVVP